MIQELFSFTGLQNLPILLQILIVVLSSFLSEDATLAITATLYKGEVISYLVYWIGGIAGIIIGDSILYAIGRRLVKKRKHIEYNLNKSSHRERFVLLVLVRFIPGARLPIYISAGATYYPFHLFILADLVSVPLWVYLYSLLGDAFVHFLNTNIFSALLALIFFYVVYRSISSYFKAMKDIQFSYSIRAYFYGLQRFFYYEFWPAKIFYIPQFMFVIWQTILHGGKIWLPALANPSIKNGGLVGESKTECYKLIPESHFGYLKNIPLPLADGAQRVGLIDSFLRENKINYPIIIKPEMGQRGGGVRLVKNRSEAEDYITEANFDLMAQEYCDYKNEAGVFYVRYPDGKPSQIFSITDKEFPYVVGNGTSTIAELILADKRARLISKVYFERLKQMLSKVPAKNEIIQLVSSGNHAQGAIFHDGMKKLYTKELHQALDELALQMEGFFIGRFDIRYKSEEQFHKGLDFKIIEINGAGAEATHIYDSRLNIIQAYAVLYRQVELIYKIGAQTLCAGSHKPSFKQIISDWLSFRNKAKGYSVAF